VDDDDYDAEEDGAVALVSDGTNQLRGPRRGRGALALLSPNLYPLGRPGGSAGKVGLGEGPATATAPGAAAAAAAEGVVYSTSRGQRLTPPAALRGPPKTAAMAAAAAAGIRGRGGHGGGAPASPPARGAAARRALTIDIAAADATSAAAAAAAGPALRSPKIRRINARTHVV